LLVFDFDGDSYDQMRATLLPAIPKSIQCHFVGGGLKEVQRRTRFLFRGPVSLRLDTNQSTKVEVRKRLEEVYQIRQKRCELLNLRLLSSDERIPMSLVLPGLYLGNYHDMKLVGQLRTTGISAVISICQQAEQHDVQNLQKNGIKHIFIPLKDEPEACIGEHFDAVSDNIASIIQSGDNVLVGKMSCISFHNI
jgi:hypothetical protein